MTNEPSRPELATELKDLRARLADAEEALRAIRTGNVDAVLVTGEGGEQVYTLRGVDRIYRQLIETMSEGAATLSAGGVILYCNVRLAEMLGQPLDQVLGTVLRNYLPPADQQALDAILGQARTEPSRLEIHLKSGENRLVPVHLSASRLPSEEAQIVFCLVLTDLTGQESHEQIVAAERLARLILEQAAEAIVVCDEQGRIMNASQAAQRFCDGSPLLRPFAEVLPLRTDASDPFHLAPVLQGETLRDVDVTLDRQGQRLDLILNAGPLLSGHQILGCVVTLTNITERKRAEEALRESEARLRDVTFSMADWVWEVDENGVLTYSSSKGLEFFGDVIGKTPFDFMPPDEAKRHTAIFSEIAAHKAPIKDLENWNIRKNGEPICLLSNGVPILDEAGNLKGYRGVDKDITERKRAEVALRSSEKRFRALVEHSGDFISLVALDGTLLWESPSAIRPLGYAPDSFLGRNTFELVHPDDADRVRDLLAQAVQQPAVPQHGVFRLLRVDGAWIWVEASATNLLGDESVRAIVVNYRDITERKQVEEALRKSESDYRYLFNEANDAILIFEPEQEVILEANAAACAVYGFTHAELVGMSLKALTRDVPTGEAQLDALLDTGSYRDFESQHFTRKGEPIHFLINSSVIAYRGAKAILSINRDITARKRVGRALRLQSAALNAAANAIIITDRNGTIEWINAAFTSMTGYSAEEAISRNPRGLVKSGVHDGAFYKAMWDTILAGDVWRGETTNRRKDGSLYPEEQTITPVKNDRGEITHFIAIKQDLTEQHRLEAQFLQAQKMETVGQLAGGIAHDFNNLLTVINGTAELVLDQVSQDDKVRADVQEIFKAGERAAVLTRQLLAFSRQQILEPRVLSLNTVVAGMGSLLHRLLGEDIDLVIVPTPALGSVKADLGQIEQVISNLAVNARDAMPQGGRLTIETENVTIDENYARQHGVAVPPGPYVMLAVSDSGVGMDEATRARIFEPFFTTKGPGKGTGLGLSTVYGIVKQSYGFVWVYSEVGQGTSFKIYLPQVTEVAATDRREPTVVSSVGTETILLAEDNAGLRTLATRVLEPAGYTVLGAATGEEALRLLEGHEERVHLLLSDVVMPGMSGRHLAERLAQTHPGMKVLYMSGYTSDTIVQHGVLEAQVPFLNKPFTAAALLRKIREVLDS